MRERSTSKSFKYYRDNEGTLLDRVEYLKIINGFSKFIVKNVLDGNQCVLPSRLGTLSIIGNKVKVKIDSQGKIKNLAPDWVKTKKLWDSNPAYKIEKRLVYHLNENTNGVRYKILWSKSGVLVENKTLYSFIACRAFKREIHKRIKNGQEYMLNNKNYHGDN